MSGGVGGGRGAIPCPRPDRIMLVDKPYGAPGFQTGGHSSEFHFVWATDPYGRVAQKGPTPKSQIPSTKSQEESVQAPQLLNDRTTLTRIGFRRLGDGSLSFGRST